MKHQILIQGSYNCTIPTKECYEWVQSKGYDLNTLLGIRHHPVLIEMFHEFAETTKNGVQILYGQPDKYGWRGYYMLQEIEGETYRIVEYDGLEGVDTPDNYKWVTIKEDEV